MTEGAPPDETDAEAADEASAGHQPDESAAADDGAADADGRHVAVGQTHFSAPRGWRVVVIRCPPRPRAAGPRPRHCRRESGRGR